MNFVDERHALYVGWVLGLALKNGLPVDLVDDDDGNHTDRLDLSLPLGGGVVTVTIVVPPPPAEWVLSEQIDGSVP